MLKIAIFLGPYFFFALAAWPAPWEGLPLPTKLLTEDIFRPIPPIPRIPLAPSGRRSPTDSRNRFIRLKLSAPLTAYCKKLDQAFRRWGWGRSRCETFNWHHVRNSVNGDPLIWMAYGNEEQHQAEKLDATLIFCTVHGDEITPVKFCFDILYYLQEEAGRFSDRMVVVAPVVNPDSFLKERPTRTNARGVDINRNFPTRDWHRDALRLWKSRYREDKRRYPGEAPLSEPETLFQVNLIKRYRPSKIISVHAPLTLLDYDGPLEQLENQNRSAAIAKQLLIQMSEKAEGYRIANYPFFPGSLGNWAGNERKIPTYTLELPSSDNREHQHFWKSFKGPIVEAISLNFRNKQSI